MLVVYNGKIVTNNKVVRGKLIIKSDDYILYKIREVFLWKKRNHILV